MDLISAAAFSVTEITGSFMVLVSITIIFILKLPANHESVKQPRYFLTLSKCSRAFRDLASNTERSGGKVSPKLVQIFNACPQSSKSSEQMRKAFSPAS